MNARRPITIRHSGVPRSGEPGIHNHACRGLYAEICRHEQGLWIPALAALGRNDSAGARQ
jgi:hypothetical protein